MATQVGFQIPLAQTNGLQLNTEVPQSPFNMWLQKVQSVWEDHGTRIMWPYTVMLPFNKHRCVWWYCRYSADGEVWCALYICQNKKVFHRKGESWLRFICVPNLHDSHCSTKWKMESKILENVALWLCWWCFRRRVFCSSQKGFSSSLGGWIQTMLHHKQERAVSATT